MILTKTTDWRICERMVYAAAEGERRYEAMKPHPQPKRPVMVKDAFGRWSAEALK